MKIAINNDWLFSECITEEMKSITYDDSAMTSVRIPHTCQETPYNYFDEAIYQMVSCYRKKFNYEEGWKDKRVFLNFDGVGHIARVYLNGKYLGEHLCGYTAFRFEITDTLSKSDENVLVVEVDSRESNNIPPFGNVIDYMTYGGIYREVSIEVLEEIYIDDIYVRTSNVLEVKKDLAVDVTLSDYSEGLSIKTYITNADTEQKLGEKNIDDILCSANYKVSDVKLWSIKSPNLYGLKVELYKNEVLFDTKVIRFGFRECEFRLDGFYLNNEKIKIMGLNRHQSYAYVGYAMPKRAQELDAEILKYELGVNAVRTSHYPQSKHFINRCDELGLLVFTEIVGWQHIGDESWKDIAVRTTEEMVMQYRNHPSIIIWGVRINESADDDAFYQRTNDIAHKLDATRQTGGVRFITKSNLLEDVYTFNDFSHTGENEGTSKKKNITSDMSKPYLVTEYNGHMYPTKAYDDEKHRLSHAKRHANVIQGYSNDNESSGGFGWCMFDYNTHKDFGSGDRICYHGVMTMFRNPKLAASVYASQSDIKPVLEISSTMGIGDYAGGNLEEVYAFTNADSVKLYKNDKFVKEFYPNKEKYSALLHPPIHIDDLIGELLNEEGYSAKSNERVKAVLRAVSKYGQNGMPLKYKLMMLMVIIKEKISLSDGIRLYYKYVGNWGDESTKYRFDAIQNGGIIKSINKEAVKGIKLKVINDTDTLIEGDTYDVSSVRIQIVDINGEVVPYSTEIIYFETEGDIELIGPKCANSIGGGTGTFVKSIGRSGSGKLHIWSDNLEKITLDYTVQ